MDTFPTEPFISQHDAPLIEHLRDEEQTLAILLVAVREIRQALLNRDGERLTQALQAEADSFQMGAEMRERRVVFRQQMAERLQIDPAEVTFSRLEECVSEETRGELAKIRKRLQEMSDELLRLNRQNAAMIQQTLDLTERIVGSLTGSGPHFSGYNATGRSETTHSGPVVQWGG